MLILVLVLCLVSAGVAQNNGTFVVTAPKIARVGTSYTVNVLLTEQRNSIQTGSIVFTHEKDKSQMKTVAFSVDPAAYKTDVQIDFSPGELKLGKYYMKLLLDGLSIRASHEIELKGGSGAILVQTDKGIYKRSQTVKMRTFIMDVDLKAVKKLMDITIIDPDGNKVAQFKNQTSTSGVVTQEYTLSNDPKLGLWKIAVQQTDGKGSAAERNFTVDAYVLPRFSVEVKPSVSFLYVKDFSSVNIEVEALYNYGEGVHGRVLLKYLLNGTTRQKSQRLVDGKGTITISTADIGDPSLLRQKFCGQYCYYSYQRSFPMSIVAEVIEDETEEKQQGRTNLNFYTEPVAMEIIDKKVYRKNMKHTFYLHVTDPSGAPLPMGERTKYFVNVLDRNREMLNFRKLPLDTSVADIMMSFTTEKPITRDLNIEVNLVDENNVVILKEYGNPQQYQSFGSEGVLITLMETSSGDNVRPPNMAYDVGDTIHVKTTSIGGFKMPLYLFLFAKGKLIQSYQVSSDDITAITVTSDMAPSSSLLLYSVTSQNELIADEMKILVSGLMKNQMAMKFNVDRQKVGRDVTLTVNTDPNSFIFLVGIDKGSQLLKAPNDITQNQVKEGLMEFDIREEDTMDDSRIMFKRKKRFALRSFFYGKGAKEILETVGVVCMTDAYVAEVNGWDDLILNDEVVAMAPEMNEGAVLKPRSSETLDKRESVQNDDEVRKNFPETWVWLNAVASSDGSFQKTVQLPDTITAWVTRGFALSPTNGLGIAYNIQVEGFKQFFVIVSLPATAVREEKLQVKLVVFNYFDDLKAVRITVNHSPDFEIYDDYLNTTQPLSAGTNWIGDIQVPSRLSKGTSVYIKPTTLGKLRIRAEASTGTKITDVQDIVQKEIHVDPEGTTMYGGVQELMEATSSIQTLQIIPDFPAEYVSGSRKVVVSVTGDIMGQSLQNLDSMIRAPYGCGEQNMISLVPNIYALSYMTATGNLNPDIKKRAEENINSGYSRELNYKHYNGGYSAFGKSDSSFSTWLTAFVMKSFAQASKFVFIDDSVLEEAKEAIMSQSNRDGSFNEPGRVLHKDMMTGTSSGAMLTAYIYIALQETQKAGNAIPGSFDSSLTLKYLENFYKDASKSKTPFQLAVLSYCFALGGSLELDSILMEINDIATETDSGDMKCWCDMRKQQSGGGLKSRYMTYDIKPSTIETASYVVLTYLEQNDVSKARPIVRWLVSQINGKGGWMSTQDTVMGLQALSTYAEKLSSGPKDATVTFKSPGNADVQFAINSGNAVLLQSQNLANLDQLGSNPVTAEIKGAGNVVVAVNWEYNVEKQENFKDLNIVITPYKLLSGGIKIEACIWYNGIGDYGMGMMYVDIPTGYMVTNMNNLVENNQIQRVEQNGKTMAFYFNQLSSSRMCIDIHTMVEYIVMDAKPSLARAQFYYSPEKMTSTAFSVTAPIAPTGSATCINIPVLLMTLLTAVHMIIRLF